MIAALLGPTTERWLIDTIQRKGLDNLFLLALAVYAVSIALAGLAGWFLSGVLRVANLRKTLAEALKIEGEVTSQQEVLLKSVRTTREALEAADSLLTDGLRELRKRLEAKQNNKADEAREAVCHCLNKDLGSALETHCEQIEYLLPRRLRQREVRKKIVPCT